MKKLIDMLKKKIEKESNTIGYLSLIERKRNRSAIISAEVENLKIKTKRNIRNVAWANDYRNRFGPKHEEFWTAIKREWKGEVEGRVLSAIVVSLHRFPLYTIQRAGQFQDTSLGGGGGGVGVNCSSNGTAISFPQLRTRLLARRLSRVRIYNGDIPVKTRV